MSKLTLYALVFTTVLSVFAGGAAFVLHGLWSDAKDKIEALETARDRAEENLKRVSEQLADERLLREATEDALTALRSVPDEEYTQELPPAVRNVLRDFRERMQ